MSNWSEHNYIAQNYLCNAWDLEYGPIHMVDAQIAIT